jgi:hypothetical protein
MRRKPLLLGALFVLVNATLLVLVLHGTASGQLQSQFGNATMWLRLINASGPGGDGGIIEATGDSAGRMLVSGTLVSTAPDGGMLILAPDGGLVVAPVAVSSLPTPVSVEVLNTPAAPVPVSAVGPVSVEPPDGGLPVTEVPGTNWLWVNDGGLGPEAGVTSAIVELAPGESSLQSAMVQSPDTPDGGLLFCLWDGNPDPDAGANPVPLGYVWFTQPGPPVVWSSPSPKGVPYHSGLYLSVGAAPPNGPGCPAPAYFLNGWVVAVTSP